MTKCYQKTCQFRQINGCIVEANIQGGGITSRMVVCYCYDRPIGTWD